MEWQVTYGSFVVKRDDDGRIIAEDVCSRVRWSRSLLESADHNYLT